VSGYARIHRSLIGHPAFRNDAEGMAFAWLVLRASWEPARVRYKGKAIALARGQLALSVRDFAEAMDRDKGWVERLLKRLKSETMVETRSETGVLVITICNYDEYQAETTERKTPRKTLRETPARQRQDTEQRREKGKKEDTPPTPPAGGRRGKARFPEDWTLPAVAELSPQARACAEQWTSASYETHGEAFASYWRGNGKMMVDWKATWANRVVALHSQVMRDQKFGNAPTSITLAKPADPQVFQRFCDSQIERFRSQGNEREALAWERKKRGEEPRNEATGPPRSIGALTAGIAQQAGMH
jgi:hypothetical protein